MAYAARYPTHLNGLVLVGSASLRPGSTNAEISRRLRARLTEADIDSIRALSGLVTDPARRDSALRAIYLLNWKAYEYDPANVRALAADFPPGSFNERTSALMNRDLLRSGAAVGEQLDTSAVTRAIPVLIVYGAVDAIGAVTVAELSRRFPQATVTIIPRSGHHPWSEAPSAFYAVVDDFLGARSLTSGR